MYIIRHGQTPWNARKCLQGRSDVDLNENGIYLAELPGAYSAPVQIHVEEDKLGQEMYCLLTSYDSDSNIIGLTNVLTLSGNDYLDHADVIRQMLKDAEND
mgnify:CR=1 FL=1